MNLFVRIGMYHFGVMDGLLVVLVIVLTLLIQGGCQTEESMTFRSAEMPHTPRETQWHVVVPGESLTTIAQLYDSSREELVRLNNDLFEQFERKRCQKFKIYPGGYCEGLHGFPDPATHGSSALQPGDQIKVPVW